MYISAFINREIQGAPRAVACIDREKCRHFIIRALVAVMLFMTVCSADGRRRTWSIDPHYPVYVKNGVVVCPDGRYTLDVNTFYVDSRLKPEETNSPYMFRSITDAVRHLKDGTCDKPMRLLFAPGVYWADNPDDTTVATGINGREPFGMVIRCSNLRLTGLTHDARNVVIASSRGHTQGAAGNFTMLDIWGDGLVVENMTLGNFCNADLIFPLDTTENRRRRSDAITQAHVGYVHGDRMTARNVRFISRLNLNPLSGARRVLYDSCHFECTDDALTGNGVYLNSTFDFYGQKPFYTTDVAGAVFLGCCFRAMGANREMVFCKSPGQLTLVNCSYEARAGSDVGWTNYPTEQLRCYQYGVTLNGERYVVGKGKPHNTVIMDSLPLLKAYLLDGGRYNIANLLGGNDGWMPAGSRGYGGFDNMPTHLQLSRRKAVLTTGRDTLMLSACQLLHGNYPLADSPDTAEIFWSVAPGYEKYVRLSADWGGTIVVTPLNMEDETVRFCVMSRTEYGLEAACELEVRPETLPPPELMSAPEIIIEKYSVARLAYTLALDGRRDNSSVTWLRSEDGTMDGAVVVAVSRNGIPEREYPLRDEDAGRYLIAELVPCHHRSLPGDTVRVARMVRAGGEYGIRSGRSSLRSTHLFSDFHSFPTSWQPRVAPGYWTVDGYKPADTEQYQWTFVRERDMWAYGKGYNGAKGSGLLQAQRGARLMFTPLDAAYGNMRLVLNVDPTKTAGQGFGSATGQYMDIGIKMDTQTLSGYALRIIRTVKSAKAVDFLLVRYDNGTVTPITPPVTSDCYRTGCTIRLSIDGDTLAADVSTSSPPSAAPVAHSVSLNACVESTDKGGVMIQHTGTCGESTTMLHGIDVVWE